MRRVLMTADTVGGVWTYALELADALAPSGVEVVLATMGRPLSDRQWAEVRSSAVAEVRQSAYALEWMDEPWADVDRAAGWLLGLEDELRPDVVHLNGYCHAALPWRAPVVTVAHSCVVSWWQAVRGEDPPPAWREYAARVRAGLANADAVVAPTAAMLRSLSWYGGVEGVVVPNCRRPEAISPASKRPMVLAAGRLWDEAKNVAALDRVAPSLDARVLIAGDPASPDGRTWRAEAAELLGPLPFDQLAVWMRSASVFAAPARYEPFGLAALEAGLAGCALVLGDIASLREVWADAALYVPPDDDEALRATLRALLTDDPRRHDLARRARARASAYTPARTAHGYLEVYERVGEPVGSVR